MYYLYKTKIFLQFALSKKGLSLLPFTFYLPFLMDDEKKGIMLLVIFMTGDFVTGIAASSSRRKKAIEIDPKLKEQRLVSSKKLKGSGKKFLLYGGTVLIAFLIQDVFKLKQFNIPISHLNFSFTMGVLFFWCSVEIYSIVFENLKELGVDVKELFKKIVSVFTEIKQEKDKIL